MMYGLDYLGGAKFKQLVLDEHPNGWAAGMFTNVFGDAMPLAVALARTERCPRMRLQLHWEDDHKEKKDTFKKIEAEAKRVGRIINNIAWVDWRVSGFCENVLSASRAAVLRDLVMEHMPNEGTSYVHSPLLKMGGHVLPGVINEIHGDDNRTVSGRMDFSFDGTGAFDADVTAYKSKFSKSETFYLWYSGMNGRLNDADKTPRPQRKAWPTSRYIDSLIYLSRDRGTVKIPADWILKSHSDRHTTPPEPRAGKPVIICPDAGDVITCVTAKDQVICTAKKGPLFKESRPGKPKRYIYRIDADWGYLLAEKALRISGSPRVKLRVRGKSVGIAHLAFRGGTFR